MKSLKLFTVAVIFIGLGGCLSFSSNKGTPGPEGPQGSQGIQGPAGTSEKIIVVPAKQY